MKRKRVVQTRLCRCNHSFSVEEDEEQRQCYLMDTWSLDRNHADSVFLNWRNETENDLNNQNDWEMNYRPFFDRALYILLQNIPLISELKWIIIRILIPKSWDQVQEDDLDLKRTFDFMFERTSQSSYWYLEKFQV